MNIVETFSEKKNHSCHAKLEEYNRRGVFESVIRAYTLEEEKKS